MKTVFKLDQAKWMKDKSPAKICLEIDSQPIFVFIEMKDVRYFIKHRDLELFAVNILKALKSKKLKP